MIATEQRLKCHKFKKFCDQSGSTNMSEMWKIKKKLWPKKSSSLPTAKINHFGKLVSSGKDLKNTLRKEYKERLRARPKHPFMKKLYKSQTIEYKLKLAKENKSLPISMKELEEVLSKTKTGKARDPDGLAREVFKLDLIGQDLKESLLRMLNLIKNQGIIPKFMRKANIYPRKIRQDCI